MSGNSENRTYKGVPLVYGTEVGPQAQKDGIDRASSVPKHYDANWRNNPELSVKDRAEAQQAELDTVAYLLRIKNSELRKLTEAQETKLAKILETIKAEKASRNELLSEEGAIEELMVPKALNLAEIDVARSSLARRRDLDNGVQPAFRSKK